MTLSQIRYFCAACKYGSITKAAEELYVTQPTITVAIRGLEKEYQLSLLERSGKTISLTAEGKLFYQHAKIMLVHVKEFEKNVAYIAGKDMSIRLGVTKGIGVAAFADYLRERKHKWDETKIKLYEASSARLFEMLRKKELDIILVPDYGADEMEDMEHETLKQSYMCLCMSKKHPLACEEKIFIDMIVNEKFISTDNDEFKNRALKNLYEKKGYLKEPEIIARYEQLNVTMKMIESDLGVGYFAGEAVEQYTGIVSKRIEEDTPVPVKIVWRSEKLKNELKEFIQDMKEHYCET